MDAEERRDLRNRLKEHLAGPLPDDIRAEVEKALAPPPAKPTLWQRLKRQLGFSR